jgi:sugar O-acyltransferase (sialic acid O-acetyltransferase NeuD family)
MGRHPIGFANHTVPQPRASVPNPLVILGARSFAREVADILSDLPEFTLAGFVENLDRDRCAETIDGLPVFWIDALADLAATHLGVCALGSTKRRHFIEEAIRLGVGFATIVHPSARLSARSTLGQGTIVCPGAQIASHTRIGRHVLVNRGALIGHDVEIGDYVTIGPGANIAGFCRIGSGSYIGIGSTIVDRLTVGTGVVVAAGATVHRDVPDHTMVAGPGARAVKRDVDGL